MYNILYYSNASVEITFRVLHGLDPEEIINEQKVS